MFSVFYFYFNGRTNAFTYFQIMHRYVCAPQYACVRVCKCVFYRVNWLSLSLAGLPIEIAKNFSCSPSRHLSPLSVCLSACHRCVRFVCYYRSRVSRYYVIICELNCNREIQIHRERGSEMGRG